LHDNQNIRLYFEEKSANNYGKSSKNRAPKQPYVNTSQHVLSGFESTFSQALKIDG